MSEAPSPPGTYLLRELHDVSVPASISWYPQTIGWKILALIAIAFVLYGVYRWGKHWWDNRYRQEAYKAIEALNPTDANMPQELFSILKLVLVYINSHNAKLFGMAFLNALNRLSSQTKDFSDDISIRWLNSIINPHVELTQEHRLILIERAKQWVLEHAIIPLSLKEGDTQLNTHVEKKATDNKKRAIGQHYE